MADVVEVLLQFVMV